MESLGKTAGLFVVAFLVIFSAIVGAGYLVKIGSLPESLFWVILFFAVITIIALLAFVLAHQGKIDGKNLTEILSSVLNTIGVNKKGEDKSIEKNSRRFL